MLRLKTHRETEVYYRPMASNESRGEVLYRTLKGTTSITWDSTKIFKISSLACFKKNDDSILWSPCVEDNTEDPVSTQLGT